MNNNHFFAMMSRMKLIKRWGLMRNTINESLSEHSLETAIIAHALVIISNKRYNTAYSADKAAVLAMYHDSSEIITGDLPTPVKYFNPEIQTAYKKVESIANNKLLDMLPEDLRDEYEKTLNPSKDESDIIKLVKAADKISALIKCIEERKMGNCEFGKAEETIFKAIKDMKLPAAGDFLRDFLPSYSLTLDEQS